MIMPGRIWVAGIAIPNFSSVPRNLLMAGANTRLYLTVRMESQRRNENNPGDFFYARTTLLRASFSKEESKCLRGAKGKPTNRTTRGGAMPKVRDIMSSEVETASPDTTLEEIATMMKDQDVGAVPVVEDEELVGIITDRDIVVRCIAEGKDPSETNAEDVLSEDLETASPEMDVEEAISLMSSRQIRRLPVVEENRLVGILALGDIAVKQDDKVAGEALEDISQGVKGEKKKPQTVGQRDVDTANRRGNRAVQPIRSGGRNQTSGARGRQSGSARGRDEEEANTSQQRSKQGISNRGQSSEKARQERVNPSRAAGRSKARRRAS
jgi:CBS domain-containing protein